MEETLENDPVFPVQDKLRPLNGKQKFIFPLIEDIQMTLTRDEDSSVLISIENSLMTLALNRPKCHQQPHP